MMTHSPVYKLLVVSYMMMVRYDRVNVYEVNEKGKVKRRYGY